MRKLTATEYRKTLADLLSFALRDAKAAASVMDALAPQLADLVDERPKLADDTHGTSRRLDQTVDQTDVNATYALAGAVGAQLTGQGRLGALAGACATDADTANDDACITSFIQRFGERAFRRPLSPDEVTLFRSVYGPSPAIDADAFADVIAATLSAPRFLYHVEHGEAPVAGKPDLMTLSPYELASRLSYQFWETMPDDELWGLARSGALSQPDVYASQVDRMMADPRARQTFDEFFQEWLKVEYLPPLDQRNKDVLFKTFAAADLPTAGLRQAMIDDAVALPHHLTWNAGGRFEDLLTSDLAFPRRAELIMRGVFVRRFLLCDAPACAGCRATLLNPIGYTLEGFDALGRARASERLFSKSTGKELGRARIDTHAVPQIVPGDDRPASVKVNSYRKTFRTMMVDLASKLDVEEAPGRTFLDNSLIVWTQESGHLAHYGVDLPVVTFGSAGGFFRTRQYVDFRNQTPATAKNYYGRIAYYGPTWQRWLAIQLQAMGIPRAEFERDGQQGYAQPFVAPGFDTRFVPAALANQSEVPPPLKA